MTKKTLARVFTCQCGRPIFFRNSRCVACGTPLGYDPDHLELMPLQQADGPGTWCRFVDAESDTDTDTDTGNARAYVRCSNFDSAAACNWLLPWQPGSTVTLCRCCRLNRTIPDLGMSDNPMLWSRVELAKRRLVSSLIGLKLPVTSRAGDPPEDAQWGLAFDLLRPQPGGPPVVTGHVDGVVTLNIEEADDARRELARVALHEPYRTLLGHLRHEVGHYYWWRLVEGRDWHEPFRALFGSEQEDYAGALERHYRNGPKVDWYSAHVSAYASAHPWEDWAETWAHYLHMVDTLDTAASFEVDAQSSEVQYEPFTPQALYWPQAPDAERFLDFINGWVQLTGVLNEFARAMGQADLYPFVLSNRAVAKLQFVHLVVTAQWASRLPLPAGDVPIASPSPQPPAQEPMP